MRLLLYIIIRGFVFQNRIWQELGVIFRIYWDDEYTRLSAHIGKSLAWSRNIKLLCHTTNKYVFFTVVIFLLAMKTKTKILEEINQSLLLNRVRKDRYIYLIYILSHGIIENDLQKTLT